MVTCIWPVDPTLCCAGVDIDPEDPVVQNVIEQVSVMLTVWSGGAYGGCRTVRPLGPCPVCRSGCCGSGDCIVLHDTTGVIEVRVDGEVIDPTLYNYSDRGTLCAVPPYTWPTADPRWQDTGTLEVDVRTGAVPDAWALSVAAELACELIKSCQNVKCRLPANATQVSSLGVTVQLDADEIKYAIPAVRAWVASINPAGATMPARVFSPEADRARLVGTRRPTWRAPWQPR